MHKGLNLNTTWNRQDTEDTFKHTLGAILAIQTLRLIE